MVFVPHWERYKDKKPTGLVEIDYGHELSKNLKHCYFFGNLTNNVDLVTNTSSEFVGTNISNVDDGVLISGSSSYINLGILPISDFSEISILLKYKDRTSADAFARYFGILYSGSDDIRLYENSTVLTFAFDNGSQTNSNIGLVSGLSNEIALTHTGSLQTGFRDGSFVVSASDGCSFSGFNGLTYIGSSPSFSGNIRATFERFLVFDKALSEDEVFALYEAPYQILKPRKTFFVLTQSSGVTASVTGAFASLSAGTLSASAVYNTPTRLQPVSTSTLSAQVEAYITEQLTGAGLTATAGNSVSAIDHSLSGESIALAQGLVQGIIEALLTGQQLTGQSGSLQSAIDKALTGQPISSELDNITSAIGQALTGQSASTNISALSEAIAHSLTGQSINMIAGFVELIGNVVRGLTGEPLAVAQTSLTYDLTQNLLGGSVTTSSGVVEVSVNQGLTGSVIALSIGDLALQGQTARQLVGALISATSGSVQSAIESSLSGQAIALTQATIESAVSSLLAGQTITIEQGSSSVTLEKTLAGETVISGQGTIVFESLDQSATLTGLQIQTSAGIVLVDGVRDTRLVNVIAMGNSGYVVVLDASTKVIIQDNGNKVIN